MTNLFRVNLIVVLNKSQTQVLMCHRQKDPYYLKYNFVGGKLEAQESPLDGAYRELYEETGISSSHIELIPLFTTTYFPDQLALEVFVGTLNQDVELIEEANPLEWIGLDEDFLNLKFAGDGNVSHIISCVKDLYNL